MFPIVSVLGFDQSTIDTDLTDIIQKLQAIIDDSGTIKTTVEAILADMVGEATFIASIAELNLAIASLAEDIDLAIAALGASIAAGLAAQTAGLIANANTNTTTVVNKINSLQDVLTAINTALGVVSNNVVTLVGIGDNIISRLDSLLVVCNSIDAQFGAINLTLDQILAEVSTIAVTTNDIANHAIDTNLILDNTYGLLDLRFLQFQVHLDSLDDKVSQTNDLLTEIRDILALQLPNIQATLTTSNALFLDNLTSTPPGLPLYHCVKRLNDALALGGYYSEDTSPAALRVLVTG